jgi:hypothetical protein
MGEGILAVIILAGGWLACSATQERREALLFNDKSTPLGIRKPIFRE